MEFMDFQIVGRHVARNITGICVHLRPIRPRKSPLAYSVALVPTVFESTWAIFGVENYTGVVIGCKSLNLAVFFISSVEEKKKRGGEVVGVWLVSFFWFTVELH